MKPSARVQNGGAPLVPLCNLHLEHSKHFLRKVRFPLRAHSLAGKSSVCLSNKSRVKLDIVQSCFVLLLFYPAVVSASCYNLFELGKCATLRHVCSSPLAGSDGKQEAKHFG